MLRHLLVASAMMVAASWVGGTAAEPLQASAAARAVAIEDPFRLGASTGYATIGVSRRQAQLVLRVESLDIVRSEPSALVLPPSGFSASPGSSIGSLALAAPLAGGEPLLTLFDHVERDNGRSGPEQVTVGLDYSFIDDEDMGFEVAEAGAMESAYSSHKLMLTARFSF